MNNKRKYFACSSIVCLSAFLLMATAANNKYVSYSANAGLQSDSIDLVNAFQGKTIEEGVVTFEKDDYLFTFLVDNVTIGDGFITIADGGYIRNATAFNGLETIELSGAYDKALLSTGTLVDLEIAKGSDNVAAEAINEVTSGTHFKLEAYTGDVTLQSLELNYACGSEVVTDTSSSWGYLWDFRGLGTETNPVLISNLTDWNRFAALSLDHNFDGVHFALTDNIDARGTKNSLTLAYPNVTTWFNGHFDGRGYTISFDVETTAARQALIGKTGNAVIENLNVAGTLTGPDVLGGIVAENYGNTTISNCVSSVAITVNSTNCTSTGGIVGLHKISADFAPAALTIDGCEFAGSFVGNYFRNSGGIVGNVNTIYSNTVINNCINRASINTSYEGIGGIVGRFNKSATISLEISNCLNTETATLTSAYDSVGGIVGKTLCETTISNCVNDADITVNNNGISSAGGIVGYADEYYTYTINNCTNNGDVYGNRFVAGILARDETLHGNTRINNCVNTGTISAKVKGNTAKVGGILGGTPEGTRTSPSTSTIINSCVNYGKITSLENTNATIAIGGVASTAGFFVDIYNSVNYGDIVSKGGYVGGITGVSRAASNIQECSNYGAVTGGNERVGGIVGSLADGCKTKNCINYGSVTGGICTGGIAGIYFPKNKVLNSVTYTPELSNCINYGNVHSITKYAGGIVGGSGDASSTGTISSCTNFGSVSSVEGIHAGILGSDCGKTTTSYQNFLIDCVSYVAPDGTNGNISTSSSYILSTLNGLHADTTVTNNIALRPNTWALEDGDTYAAILSKGESTNTVTLTKEGILCWLEADLLQYENVQFVILDSSNAVKSSTPVLRLGAGSIYSINAIEGTTATGNWTENNKVVEIRIDASKWDAGSGYFAAYCEGYFGHEVYEMEYDSIDNVYKCEVNAGLYHKVKFLLMSEGSTLGESLDDNLALCTEQSEFVGLHSLSTLTFTKLGTHNNNVVGTWVN